MDLWTKEEIRRWNQQQDEEEAQQKKLQQQLKIASATLLHDLYTAIFHIKDYIEQLKQAVVDIHPHSNLFNDQTSGANCNDDDDEKHEFKIILQEDCKPLAHFCKCMERILLFGFKQNYSYFRASSLWSFIRDASNRALALCECERLQNDLQLVQSIDILNDQGKLHAFLRQSLRSKSVSLYFKLLLEQTDVIHVYYSDFGVIGDENKACALLAQLDELSYFPTFVEFQMLCRDTTLNVMHSFKHDEYGVPQWQVDKDEGNISTMVDIWLVRNRDRLGIDLKIGRKKIRGEKREKKHKKQKRKVSNTLQAPSDALQLQFKESHKKKKKKKERKEKKVRKSKSDKTCSNCSSPPASLSSLDHRMTPVIATTTDITDTPLVIENCGAIKSILDLPKTAVFPSVLVRTRTMPLSSRSRPSSVRASPGLSALKPRRISLDDLTPYMPVAYQPGPLSGSRTIQGTSTLTRRPFEFIVMDTPARIKAANNGRASTPPPLQFRSAHGNRRIVAIVVDSAESDVEGDAVQPPVPLQSYRSAPAPAQYQNTFSTTTAAVPTFSTAARLTVTRFESDDDDEKSHLEVRQRRRDEQLQKTAIELDRQIRHYQLYPAPSPSKAIESHSSIAPVTTATTTSPAHCDSSDHSDGHDEHAQEDDAQDDDAADDADDDVKKDTDEEQDEACIDLNIPLPTGAQYRFSQYMTSQFQRKRAQPHPQPQISTEDLSINASVTNSLLWTTHSVDRDAFEQSTVSQPSDFCMPVPLPSREQLKSSHWRNGLEISFTTQKLPPRDDGPLLTQQDFHCATCGLMFESDLLRRPKYHYCRYTGLLHCHQCHQSERTVIPWRVLHNLDCRPTPVCCSAKAYLDRMYSIPCITLDMFAKSDQVQQNKKIMQLHKVCFELRQINKYVQVCPYKGKLFAEIGDEYEHWMQEQHVVLSMQDCVNIITLNTCDELQALSNKLKKHIRRDCDRCNSAEHFCEICTAAKAIYPWQYQRVVQCAVCKACFHSKCWSKVNEECPRCKRTFHI